MRGEYGRKWILPQPQKSQLESPIGFGAIHAYAATVQVFLSPWGGAASQRECCCAEPARPNSLGPTPVSQPHRPRFPQSTAPAPERGRYPRP